MASVNRATAKVYKIQGSDIKDRSHPHFLGPIHLQSIYHFDGQHQNHAVQSDLNRQPHEQTRLSILESETGNCRIPVLPYRIAHEEVDKKMVMPQMLNEDHDDDRGQAETLVREDSAIKTKE